LRFFQQARDPYQEHRTDESHDDRADPSAARPNPQQAENPPADNSPENAEDDVNDNAVTSAFHDLPCQPTCDETHDDPGEKPHKHSLLGSDREQSDRWGNRL